MATQFKKNIKTPGTTSYEECIREFKSKKPKVFKALNDLELLACLAFNVFELRKEKGWSQSILAKKAGVPRRMIVCIESYVDGHDMPVGSVQKIAQALDVSFHRLFLEIDPMKL